MGCCSALNCSNSSEKNFRMFRFPSDQERRKVWITNCRREGWIPGPNAQLCSVSKIFFIKFGDENITQTIIYLSQFF